MLLRFGFNRLVIWMIGDLLHVIVLALGQGLFHGVARRILLYLCHPQSMCATIYEFVWLTKVLQDVRDEQNKAIMIKFDNHSSIKLENNLVYHARQSMLMHNFILLERSYIPNKFLLNIVILVKMLLTFSLSLLGI